MRAGRTGERRQRQVNETERQVRDMQTRGRSDESGRGEEVGCGIERRCIMVRGEQQIWRWVTIRKWRER
jgi:hypothetical protein